MSAADYQAYLQRARRAKQDTRLTEVEVNVLHCVSRGLTYRGTADVLDKPLETVKSQLAQARLKLGAKNTTHAVATALRLGLIS